MWSRSWRQNVMRRFLHVARNAKSLPRERIRIRLSFRVIVKWGRRSKRRNCRNQKRIRIWTRNQMISRQMEGKGQQLERNLQELNIGPGHSATWTVYSSLASMLANQPPSGDLGRSKHLPVQDQRSLPSLDPTAPHSRRSAPMIQLPHRRNRSRSQSRNLWTKSKLPS